MISAAEDPLRTRCVTELSSDYTVPIRMELDQATEILFNNFIDEMFNQLSKPYTTSNNEVIYIKASRPTVTNIARAFAQARLLDVSLARKTQGFYIEPENLLTITVPTGLPKKDPYRGEHAGTYLSYHKTSWESVAKILAENCVRPASWTKNEAGLPTQFPCYGFFGYSCEIADIEELQPYAIRLCTSNLYKIGKGQNPSGILAICRSPINASVPNREETTKSNVYMCSPGHSKRQRRCHGNELQLRLGLLCGLHPFCVWSSDHPDTNYGTHIRRLRAQRTTWSSTHWPSTTSNDYRNDYYNWHYFAPTTRSPHRSRTSPSWDLWSWSSRSPTTPLGQHFLLAGFLFCISWPLQPLPRRPFSRSPSWRLFWILQFASWFVQIQLVNSTTTTSTCEPSGPDRYFGVTMLLPTCSGSYSHSSVKICLTCWSSFFIWLQFLLMDVSLFALKRTMAGAKPITPRNETKQTAPSNMAAPWISDNGWG